MEMSLLDNMVKVFSKDAIDKNEVNIRIQTFKNSYRNDPQLLQLLMEAFEEVSGIKGIEPTIYDVVDISYLFKNLCDQGLFRSKKEQKYLMESLTSLYINISF